MAGGLFPPPQIIRSWPAPNHTNPETHSPAILILCCILGPLTFLVVGARLWARFRIQRNAGLDDWLMLAALVPTAGMIFCIAYGKLQLSRVAVVVRPRCSVKLPCSKHAYP